MQELTNEILKNSLWIINSEQSKRLQEKAFELGYEWSDNTSEIKNLGFPRMYFEHDLFFVSGDVVPTEKVFTERKFEDYFEPMLMDVVPTVQIPHPDPICKIQEEVSKSLGRKVAEAEEAAIKEFAKKHIQINIVDKDKFDVIFIYPKGSFMWAMQQMDQGKKVRLSTWHEEDIYIEKKGNEIVKSSGEKFVVTFITTEIDIWEIYEEKKESLSDKIILHSVHYDIGDKFSAIAVKESVAKLRPIIDNYVEMVVDKEAAWQEIKEIFGERVV